MELERIKYVINSYLRERLFKIQKNIFYVTKSEQDNPSRMTPQEAEFAVSYRQMLDDHYTNLVLRHIPGGASDTLSSEARAPNLHSAVFVSVKEDVQGVEVRDMAGLDRDHTLDLVAGSQHMFQYSAISHLLDTDHVTLI